MKGFFAKAKKTPTPVSVSSLPPQVRSNKKTLTPLPPSSPSPPHLVLPHPPPQRLELEHEYLHLRAAETGWNKSSSSFDDFQDVDDRSFDDFQDVSPEAKHKHVLAKVPQENLDHRLERPVPLKENPTPPK